MIEMHKLYRTQQLLFVRDRLAMQALCRCPQAVHLHQSQTPQQPTVLVAGIRLLQRCAWLNLLQCSQSCPPPSLRCRTGARAGYHAAASCVCHRPWNHWGGHPPVGLSLVVPLRPWTVSGALQDSVLQNSCKRFWQSSAACQWCYQDMLWDALPRYSE